MSRRRLAEDLACAFVLAILVLSGASCQRPADGPAGEPLPNQPSLARMAADAAAMETLLAMTDRMSFAEISERIQAEVPPVVDLVSASPGACRTVLNRTARFGKPALAFDPAGTPHAVFAENVMVPEPDYAGNRWRWQVRLYHCQREGQRWTEPTALPDADLYADFVRILFEADGGMLVLTFGHNNRRAPTAAGVWPGLYQIVLYRLPPGGAWSAPIVCIDETPRLLHGMDACLDAEGRLHLVWAHWISNEEPEALRHRVLEGGAWREEVLPTLPDRELMHPHLRLVGGRLHIVCKARGVWPNSGRVGVCHLVRDEAGRWSAPELLVDGTGFETVAAPAERGLVAAAHRYGRDGVPDGLVVFRADAGGRLRAAGSMAPVDHRRTLWQDLTNMDVGPDGRAYVPVVMSGSLVLVRESADGRGEACLLARAASFEQRTANPGLEIRDGRLLVWWTAIDGAGPDTWSLRLWESPVPREGWLPLADLVWRMQGGVGLDGWLRWNLEKKILAQARAADAEFDMPRAAERYLYYLLNTNLAREAKAVWLRLLKLDRAGIVEVRRQLWALRLRDRAVEYGENGYIGRLMKSLLIKRTGKGGERILSLPAQDRETVQRLITEYEQGWVVVFLADGKEAVVRPELAKLDEVAMRHCLATACVRALDGADAEGLGDIELVWKSPDLCTYVTPPRTRFKLRELATWEIRPQHTDRWTYLVNLYKRERCTERPLAEIVNGVEHVLPILLARIAEEPYHKESSRRTHLLGYLVRQPASRERVLARLLPLAASDSDNERGWAINALSQGGCYGPEYLRRMVPWIRDETDDDIRHTLLVWLAHQLKRKECRELLKEDAALRAELVDAVGKLATSEDRNVRLYVDICLKAMPPAAVTWSPWRAKAVLVKGAVPLS